MKYLGFDCAYFCWRAYHTVGELEYEGEHTGVIYGFLNQLLIQVQTFRINKPLFFWDSKHSYRKKIFPGYKDRTPKDMTEEEKEGREQVYKQMTLLRTVILPLLGFKNIIIQSGVEADDTIARHVIDRPGTTLVLTNDNDLLQLVDYCTLYSPQTKERMNGTMFRTKYGIPPKKWTKVKQIAGCSSDTVPGVVGIGERYALQYLKNELNRSGKLFEKIVSNKDIIKRNKILVALPFPKTKPVTIHEEESFNAEGFKAICDMYGLDQLSHKVDDWKESFR